MVRKSSKLIVRTGVFIAAFLACLTSANGQTWTLIGTLAPKTDLRCAYFWDTAHGVVGGVGCIYTYDSGLWKEATYPEPPDTIKSLRLLDGKNLYAASGRTCIWESTDSGSTWQKTAAPFPNADDIYLGSDTQIHAMNIKGNGMMLGTSFARINSTSCAAARDDDNLMAYSYNGGSAWSSSNPPAFDCGYCIGVDTCTGTYYTISDGAKAELYESTDGGVSWHLTYDFVNTAEDVLEGGNSGVVYIQGTNNVWRLSPGRDPQSIGGPAYGGDDRRMFAFGEYNRYLVDMIGNYVYLWDGSGNSLGNPITNVEFKSVGCNLSDISVDIDAAELTGSLRIHAYTKDGSSVTPENTTLFLYKSFDTLIYHMQIPKGQESGTIYFHDSAWPGPECNPAVAWDDSFSFKLTPNPPLITILPSIFTCHGGQIPISVSTDICDTVWIDSLRIQDAGATYSIDTGSWEIVLPGTKQTLLIPNYLPAPGLHTAVIRIFGKSLSENSIIDTTIYLSYTALPDPSTPRAVAHSTFVSNCRASVVPIVIQSLCLDSVEFSECTLTMNNGVSYSTNLTFPLTLPPSTADTLQINFPAQSLSGEYIIVAHFSGQYLGSTYTFDTTFQIRVTFSNVSNPLITDLSEVDFGSVSLCNQSDSLITYTNLGCDTITITTDETSWQSGWSADDPTFPLTLPPDSSFNVRIHFQPGAPATSYQTVSYGFELTGGKTGTTSALEMTAVAIPAVASLSLADTALNIGSFVGCSAVADTSITITNTGCDSLALSGASIDSGACFTLINGTDTTLGTNQSARYAIHFSDSASGQVSSIFHIHGLGARGGNSIDTSVTLSAFIVHPPGIAYINASIIDFGTTSICEERDSSISITNNGCDTLGLFSGDFSSLQFGFPDSIQFPILLQPNTTATFPIFTHLDTTGHPATISGVVIPAVTLSRSVTYPGEFSLAISSEASAPIGATVPVYVTRNGTVPSQADEVDFDLVYNDDILSYNNAVQHDIKYTGKTKLANGLIDRSFAMQPASDRDTIATLEFQSYLSKNEQTSIGLTHQQFLASGAVSPSCVALMDTTSTPSNFQLELVCGDSTILAALNDEPPFSIVSIQPNPAQSEITIELSGAEARPAIKICDILGQTVFTQPSASAAVAAQRLNVSALPSGTYYIRFLQDGYIATRRVKIER